MNMIVAEALRKMTGCEIYTTQGHSLWVLWCWLVQLNGYPLGLEFDRHICLVMSKLGISEPKYLSSHVKTHIQRIPSRTYDSLQPNKQRPRRSSTSQLQSWETKAGQKQRGNCVWIRTTANKTTCWLCLKNRGCSVGSHAHRHCRSFPPECPMLDEDAMEFHVWRNLIRRICKSRVKEKCYWSKDAWV
jgi:hypothetical protein